MFLSLFLCFEKEITLVGDLFFGLVIFWIVEEVFDWLMEYCRLGVGRTLNQLKDHSRRGAATTVVCRASRLHASKTFYGTGRVGFRIFGNETSA